MIFFDTDDTSELIKPYIFTLGDDIKKDDIPIQKHFTNVDLAIRYLNMYSDLNVYINKLNNNQVLPMTNTVLEQVKHTAHQINSVFWSLGIVNLAKECSNVYYLQVSESKTKYGSDAYPF